MIPVRIAGLALDVKQQPVVILKPLDEEPGQGSMLPIWIGGLEAAAILAGADGNPAPRPLTLDLMRAMLESLDAEVERIAVTKLENGTFFAEIRLSTPAGERVLDARPSDAIGLADEVLEQAGVPDEREGDADEEAEVAAFSEFLDQVDPEDFQG